jgi:pilus assembly protein CpaB
MNAKAWIPLALALALGLAAAFMAKNLITGQNPVPRASDTTVTVVAAADSLQPGVQLAEEHLTTITLAGDVPEGAFTAKEPLIGRVLNVTVVKGQQITEAFLTPLGAGAGLQALVPAGMRAITVEVNEFSGMAGLINPGCRVDIVTTFNDQKGPMARIIVQNVKVTAVGARTGVQKDPEEGMARSVTLLVTPEQAEAIELATYASRPRLVLRSYGDNDPVEASGITVAELRGAKPEQSAPIDPVPVVEEKPTRAQQDPFAQEDSREAAARKPARQRTVTVIRGGNESTVTMEVPAAPPSAVVTDTDINTVTP